jgi:hypothetical protein
MRELTLKQQKLRNSIYSFIYWASLIGILLWYILKSTGIIQTPLWIELSPVAIAVFGAGAVVQQMRSDIFSLKGGFVKLQRNMEHVQQGLATLAQRTNHMEGDLHDVKARLR